MEHNTQIEDIEDYTKVPKLIGESTIKMLFDDLIKNIGHEHTTTTTREIELFIKQLQKKYKITPSKRQLRYINDKYFSDNKYKLNKAFCRFLISNAGRSRSGVLVSTVVLKPSVFSCPKNCAYCPTETDLNGKNTQPKSYLSSEPAMLRAIQYDFDVCGQIWDRINAYIKTGNIKDSNESSNSYKMEIILSGGTWESYPFDYREQVMNEIYWAANTFNVNRKIEREILSIEKEISINETSKYRIIGLTIETRPDFITNKSIRDYRKWGVTRVQIGVQHYNDDILYKINRDCYTVDTIKAIRKLKQVGFKVVCHLMPDLPGSSPELDAWMFKESITNPDLQFDDVKVYPTAVCKSSNPNLIVQSDIAKWYAEGTYTPYAETNLNDLINVLVNYKINIQPWVRIQRLVRDIPSQSIEAGYDKISNLRQVIQDKMKKEGTQCRCIRCMEIGDNEELMKNVRLVVRQYPASEGIEYYISFESNKKENIFSKNYWLYIWFLVDYYLMLFFFNRTIFWGGNDKTYNGLVGFCRLRIDPDPGGKMIPQLKNCALMREVHVYGHSLGIGSNSQSSQHKGYGKQLVKAAELIAKNNNYEKIAVIAGVGTREYYKNKCGYQLEGTYMVKNINIKYNLLSENKYKILFIVYISIFIYQMFHIILI